MESITHYLTALGLASGAGAKAAIPVLALGAFHYTPWFSLSPQWAWIASPPVMIVLGVLVLAELWLDAHPELGEYSDYVGYLPALIAGFIAFAASTGEVDQSLLQLLGSGILGGATGVVVHGVRNRIRRGFRQSIEDAHDHAPKIATAGEAGIAAAVSGAAFVAPAASIGLLVVGLLSMFALSRMLAPARRGCPHCEQPIDPRAIACPHCRGDVAPA